MVAIIAESTFRESGWGIELFASLTEALRNKRIPFCEVFDAIPPEADGVFILGADHRWLRDVILQLNDRGIRPILIGNQTEQLPGCQYSCICSDISGSMKHLLGQIRREGKAQIALYGVNTNSIADLGRMDSLFSEKSDTFHPIKLFFNEGSLQACYVSFREHLHEVDAVICTNAFAAISLLQNLKREFRRIPEHLKIYSCSHSHLLQYYSSEILTIDLNYTQYGKAAVFIYEKCKKHDYISDMTIRVPWKFTGPSRPPRIDDAPLLLPAHEDTFYDDTELSEMMRVEILLVHCDDTDRKILQLLCEGQSVPDICGQCYLTENAVKYRIKKLQQYSGTQTRRELIALLLNHLPFIPDAAPEKT